MELQAFFNDLDRAHDAEIRALGSVFCRIGLVLVAALALAWRLL